MHKTYELFITEAQYLIEHKINHIRQLCVGVLKNGSDPSHIKVPAAIESIDILVEQIKELEQYIEDY